MNWGALFNLMMAACMAGKWEPDHVFLSIWGIKCRNWFYRTSSVIERPFLDHGFYKGEGYEQVAGKGGSRHWRN